MVCFIILHYNNLNDTLECIDSLNKLYGDKKIIVVDNNTSSKLDAEKIKNCSDDFIRLDENLGYAKANNIGCSYAIEKYKPDFLIVSNNDIVVSDKNFLSKLKVIYNDFCFDLLGPKINTDGGDSINPFPVYKSRDEVLYNIKKSEKLIKIYKSKFLRFLLNIYLKFKYTFIKPRKLVNGEKREINVALHGCFIVFSKKYFEKYENVFFNDTFLYHEEEFIYQRIIKDKLISLYDPSLEVFHKEGASLDFSIKNNYDKLIFKNNEIIKSLNLLLKEMDK